MSDATTREESDFGRRTEYKLAKLADLLGFMPIAQFTGDEVLDEAIEQLGRLTTYVGSQMFRSDFKTADEMRAELDVAKEVIALLAAECRAWRERLSDARHRYCGPCRHCLAEDRIQLAQNRTNAHPAASKAVEEAKP